MRAPTNVCGAGAGIVVADSPLAAPFMESASGAVATGGGATSFDVAEGGLTSVAAGSCCALAGEAATTSALLVRAAEYS